MLQVGVVLCEHAIWKIRVRMSHISRLANGQSRAPALYSPLLGLSNLGVF